MDAERYINDVLLIALKSRNRMLGDSWTYQQDGAKPHLRQLVDKRCADNFLSFISKDCWPSNSPDLFPLDYGLWNELAKSINWNKITKKATMINVIKPSVKTNKKAESFTFCT